MFSQKNIGRGACSDSPCFTLNRRTGDLVHGRGMFRTLESGRFLPGIGRLR
jgi:hypothetical protein